MYYNGYIINVIIMDDMFDIKGSVRRNSDDSYTIFLNGKLSYESQVEVCMHELHHIVNGDFDRLGVNEIEYEAHKSAV